MNQDFASSRRDLLFKALPACSLCLGATKFAGIAETMPPQPQMPSGGRKSAVKADMTYEEIFKFAYDTLIPVMNSLSDQIGKDKYIEMLQRATSLAAVHAVEQTYHDQPKRDIATYLADMKKPDSLLQHVLTFEFVKDTQKEVDVRITDCLWARTFRQANAAELGYSLMCHPDVAAVKAYNPNITMTRLSNLMRGDKECHFIWAMTA